MKFGQAIGSVLFKNYFNLEGKATRSEYWWFMLFYPFFSFVVGFIVGELAITLGADFNQDTFSLYLTLGLLALLILPLLGLSVRRFADAGRGRTEAIVVFALLNVSQLMMPPLQIIKVAESLTTPVLVILLTSGLYTFYIALKKSV
jgi:uncharacterized membrane protein YhaH (DUF805 family)|tara:strand:- start:202 stop:639 length:438 start_codon:yes stop_codon:yes gene_type:complete